jgi:branched-subunit amino acid transport protein
LTGLSTVLSLAAASWLIRLTFIVFVPPHRLPKRFTAVAVLGCTAAIATVAHRRPSLTITAVLGVASVVVLDLILAR